MTESDLFESTLRILEGEKEIPKVTTPEQWQYLMASLRHIYGRVCSQETRIEDLEGKEKTRSDTESLREERRVTWPWILEKFGVPFVMTIVAILTTLVITGYFN